MKKWCKELFFVLMCSLPVLCLTGSASRAAAAGGAVFLSLVLMTAVTTLTPRIVPENTAPFVRLVLCAVGVSAVAIFFPTGAVFMPLCCVSSFLLFDGLDQNMRVPFRFVYCGIYGILLFLLVTVIGCVREVLGHGSIFGAKIYSFSPMEVFLLPSGLLFIAAVLFALLSSAAKEEESDA